MRELKFTQVALSELRQDVITDFNMSCNDNNIALLGSIGELYTLELTHDTDLGITFPYCFSNVQIPTDRPCEQIIENLEMREIYENCTVEESQQFALEPMYMANFTIEPPKPKTVQINWAPMRLNNNQSILCILTTYGTCRILSKTVTSREWNQQIFDPNEFLMTEIFPPKVYMTSMRRFKKFKEFIDIYWITAFAWPTTTTTATTPQKSPNIYLANAAGYIIALEFTSNNMDTIKRFWSVKTTLDRINYLKSFDQYLLAGSCNGIIKTFRVNDANVNPTIAEIECLWSKADDMSCRKVEINYASDLKVYYLLFTKAAHLLAFCLAEDGIKICSATKYVGGIKITGLESLTANEFIITTITGRVHHIHLNVVNMHEKTLTKLEISEQIINTDFDATNMQILGLATTANKSLWSFQLYHNKEYGNQSKYKSMPAFITLCKLNVIDALAILSNLNIATMDPYLDYVISMRIDLMLNLNAMHYNDFCKLSSATFSMGFNDALLQKLQIKLMLTKYAAKYQDFKLKTIKKCTIFELNFLKCCIQITYILCRLQHLQKLTIINNEIGGADRLTAFQKLAAKCMKNKFLLLVNELIEMTTENENHLKDTIECFIKLAVDEMNLKCSNEYVAADEKCAYCNESIKETTLLCSNEHKMQRCCVSYVLLPLFNKSFCSQCHTFSIDDTAALAELFPPNESIKCTFCRFSFIND